MKTKLLFAALLTLVTIALFSQNLQGNYEKHIFSDTANFSHSTFQTKANFQQSVFFSSVNFQGVKFDSAVSFLSTEFHSNANFTFTQFISSSNFQNAIFDSAVIFLKTSFKSDVAFSIAKFKSIANFSDDEFDSLAVFSLAFFDSVAIFKNAKFNSKAEFIMTQFDKLANFENAKFYTGADFRKAKLPHILNLENSRIYDGELNLLDAIVNPDYNECKINLVNSDIEKIRLLYTDFELYLPDSINADIKSNVYERLLLNQQKNGYISSIEKLDKEYQMFKYLESGKYNKIWGVFLNWVNKIWWDYGYNKILIIRNTLYLFIIFTVINSLFFKWIITNLYEMKKIVETRNLIQTKNKFYLFFRILPLSFFYTGIIFFGLKFDLNKLRYSENFQGLKFFNLIYFLLIYLSGLVCLGYLANYILSS